MNELEFIQRIDCNFPYNNREKCSALIAQAVSISDNCAFMVLHELVRPPKKVQPSLIKELYEEWKNTFNHPLVEEIEVSVNALLNNVSLETSKGLEIMKKVENYPGQYNALALAYYSTNEKSGKVKSKHNSILRAWANA